MWMWKEAAEKLKKIIKYCNENSWFISVVIFILSLVSLVFNNKIIAIIIFALLFIIWLYYVLKDHLKKINTIIVMVVSLLSFIIFIILLSINFLFSSPKIFDFTNWLNLKYNEEFNWKRININNNYKWIFEDSNNEFSTTINWTKTLATSSYPQRWYSILQSLKNLKWDRILIWKYKLKEWWKVWIRFMNTKWFNSDSIMEKHNNECILQFYKSDNTDEWYWHHITKNIFLWNESIFTNYNFIEWEYYILAKISWRQFSCYFQKEWDDIIYPIIENKNIIFENLWWPVLTRFIEDEKTFPELLEFWLYSK
jgi:energy-coupling factor transporter transmembrane protein EcfT